MVVKSSNWDPCHGTWALNRELGRRQTLSLWRRLLSCKREGIRYHLKDNVVVHPSRQNAMEKRYPVHESDVMEQCTEIQITRSLLYIQIRSSAHNPCGRSLYRACHCHTPTKWHLCPEKEKQTVLHVTTQCQQYEDHLDPHLGCGDCPRL